VVSWEIVFKTVAVERIRSDKMGEIFVRVDDRLIHGQTIVAWCPTLSIQEIVVIDDESAQNPMLKSIMTMGVPATYKTHIVTTQEAKELLSAPTNKNRLVIVKVPAKLPDIAAVITGCQFITLGNIAKRGDTIHKVNGATGIFYLSDNDVALIDTLVEKGFNVNFQQLPSTTKITWEAFKKALK
jgi:mannose/fructose/N-acetylgalactosamine-specific phosphotransferase system component IIB